MPRVKIMKCEHETCSAQLGTQPKVSASRKAQLAAKCIFCDSSRFTKFNPADQARISIYAKIYRKTEKKTQNHEAKIEGCLMCTRTKVKNIQPLGTRVKVKLWKKYGKMPRNVVYNTAASTSIL